ncbi:MAG: hypothetical protein GKR90_22700 [Pseudomonadales bacterium]|nr:hypothetical protein [Pseudomonadales bacterium]
MRSDWSKGVFQLLTLVSVFVGVGLVVYELRQTQELARAQLTSEAFMLEAQNSSSLAGENPSAALAKSCLDPQGLTVTEKLQLIGLYSQAMVSLRRIKLISEVSDVYPDGYWRQVGTGYLLPILGVKAGRAWWETLGPQDPEVRELGNAVIEQVKGNSCEATMDRWSTVIDRLTAEGQPN